jgi:tetracycline resistance efflux pump
MQLTWLSLMPPLVVIGVMLMTQQLAVSLVVGIISAGLIVTQGKLIPALSLCLEKCIAHVADLDMIYLYSLLVVISSLIVLLTVTGSAAGCARIMSKKMKTARSGELAAAILAFVLSIDDYLSILTVGLVMSPMADRLAIVRTKLAYIIHALAGPLVIIVPISTWAAAILAQLTAAGISQGSTGKILADPFYVYLASIPFIFYSIFTVIAVFFVLVSRIGFGAIKSAERDAAILSVRDIRAMDAHNTQGHSLGELLMPIGLLIGGVFLGILYAGDCFIFGGNNTFAEAFRHNNKTFLVLFISSAISFGATIALLLYKKMVTLKQLPAIMWEGFVLIRSSIMVVALASILGTFLRLDLQTGSYLASLLLGKAPLYLIPVLFFITSLVITLVTGSAWGAFSMLIPISAQMLVSFLQLHPPVTPDQIGMLFPVLGAVLSGAACGNHLSPFAETTMMTAASTGVEPLEHAKTQFIYAVPAIVATLVAFVVAGLTNGSGLLMSFLVSGGAGVGVMGLLFFILIYSEK